MHKILKFLVFIIGLVSTNLNSQSNSICNKVEAVSKLVNTFHYNPKPLNDSLSVGIYNLFIESLDQKKRLFKQSDTAAFNSDAYKIDDYISKKKCGFLDKYTNTIQARISDSKTYLEGLKDANLDYTGKDSLYFNGGKVTRYFKDDNAVKRFWNKRVRYELIYRLLEHDSVLQNLKENFNTLEKQFRPEIIEKEICFLNEIENRNGGVKKMVEEAFLNAYLQYQDPNSSYFNPSDKSLFEQGVSNSQRSFGITTFKDDNGQIVIGTIASGSPAFKSGGFDVRDEIISLKSEVSELKTDCISNDDIIAFLNDETIDKIDFKIKKKSGAIKTIALTKEELKVEENTVNGYVIGGDKPLGYIKISSFYTDLETFDGLGLTNDVAKQLYLLQREGIEGLIIDLRSNGGGSMKEASELSGMFIDRGPVAITKDRLDGLYTVRDPNRGMAFYKPIVILVDHFSASASEFFAAAMQDYKRAIVIGSKTHGKATSQQIIPLGIDKDLGFCRLTIQQFFRVTGKSHQIEGVEPDVEMPDFYDDFETEERFYKYALENETVETTLPFKPLKLYNLETIKAKSTDRISKNSAFKEIKSINRNMLTNVINRKATVPLTLDGIYKDADNFKQVWLAYSNFNNSQKQYLDFKNTSSTKERLAYNQIEEELNRQLLQSLSKDLYIYEAVNVLQDILNQN
ncbi:carboxyl-terminal processing protease [Winogradskyella wandonensis]|uniref:Carboxyl-terminal processing protease n=1 Tax=Winogradskyella wandonensis TaxID=1442586 RepID=A0A4R1KWQ7_9FLAO|nr:carboxy terminal-processing peptidase [Winogradskyella wandonensis]TCK69117.1 carboxyl-terminal processing protease [Winogradskyella wandonensis]